MKRSLDAADPTLVVGHLFTNGLHIAREILDGRGELAVFRAEPPCRPNEGYDRRRGYRESGVHEVLTLDRQETATLDPRDREEEVFHILDPRDTGAR